MAPHEYSSQEALELLLRMVEDKDANLAKALHTAIDAGKDVWESEVPANQKKRRKYRKTVSFTDEEALGVAIDTLKVYFVEQPSFTNTAIDEFAVAALDVGANMWREPFDQPQVESTGGVPIEKRLEVETRTETQISPTDKQTDHLIPTDKELIDQQKENIKRLYELVAFD